MKKTSVNKLRIKKRVKFKSSLGTGHCWTTVATCGACLTC